MQYFFLMFKRNLLTISLFWRENLSINLSKYIHIYNWHIYRIYIHTHAEGKAIRRVGGGGN